MKTASRTLQLAAVLLAVSGCSEEQSSDYVINDDCSNGKAIWVAIEAKQCGYDEWMLDWAKSNCENYGEEPCFQNFRSQQNQPTLEEQIIAAHFKKLGVGVLSISRRQLSQDPNDPIFVPQMCGLRGGSMHTLLVCEEHQSTMMSVGFSPRSEYDLDV